MKKLFLFLPFVLSAENFDQLLKLINNSNQIKIYQKNIQIQKSHIVQTKSQNYGRLDLEYSYTHLFTTPTTTMTTLAGKTEIPMGSKDNFVGALKYSYPIFTGFAIKNNIDIQKLNLIKSKLQLKNLKRNLTLNVAEIYASTYSVKAKIKALQEAKKALLSAREQAKALFDEGLINKSTVDEIDAKYYETTADIYQLQANKKMLLNNLSYILSTKISIVDDIKDVPLKKPSFLNRPDLKIIQTTLDISKKYLNIVQSNFMPQVYFQTALKKEANNLTLSHNSHQNLDKSYVAVSVKYNIFNGGSDESKKQEAKLNIIKSQLFFSDYLNKIKSDYQNDLLNLNAYKKRLNSATQEIKARKSYYEYIKAKFNQGLANVTDLNDAIAKLAEAKAKRDYIKSEIFFYTIKANIDGGK